MTIRHNLIVAAGSLTLAATISIALAWTTPAAAQARLAASSLTAGSVEPAMVRVAAKATGTRADRVRQDRRRVATAARRATAETRARRARAAVAAPIDLPPPRVRIIDTTGVGQADVQSDLP